MSFKFDTFISRFLLLIIAWWVIITINIVQLGFIKWFEPNAFSNYELVVYPLLTFVVGALLIAFWMIPGYDFLVKKKSLGVKVFGFVLHGLGYAFLYILPIFFLLGIFLQVNMQEWYLPEVKKYFLSDFHNVLKNYVYVGALLFAIDYLKGREEAIKYQSELEQQLLESKLQSVENQLQPHFLFNALNGIVSTIEEDPNKAQEALIELSNLLRFTLSSDMSELITIEEELQILDKYLSIEKLRHEEQLHIHTEIIHSGEDLKIPPMLLQPVVENAIKHGFKQHDGKLELKIIVDKKAKELSVLNNGTSLPDRLEYGNGLNIIEKRLKYHFGDHFKLSFGQQDDWVKVSIKLYEKD